MFNSWNRNSAAWYGILFSALVVGAFFARDLEWDVLWRNRWALLYGLGTSWIFALVPIAIGIVVGAALAWARADGPFFVRYPAVLFIELIRATPQLMIILWVFFIYPEITGNVLPRSWSAIFALSLISSAYLAEVIRAGLESVPSVQFESGYATGLSQLHIFIQIILPQALRNMLPALIGIFVMLFKTTTLLYVLDISDFFYIANLINNRDLAPYTIYTLLGVVYFICCFTLSKAVQRMDPKYILQS